MRSSILGRRGILLIAVCVLSASWATSHADATPPHSASNADPWQYVTTVYGFFPTVAGDTTFPNGSAGPSFKVSSRDTNLKFAAMGTMQFHKGEWGGLVDVFYANVDSASHGSRDVDVSAVPVPVGVSADGKLHTRTALVTLAGTWQFVARPDLSARLLFGVRMNGTQQRLDWTLSAPLIGYPEVSGRSSLGRTSWDAIVGVVGRQRFGPDLRWFVPYYVDLGTGNSRFTGQAMVGIGYAFDWGDVSASWRYIGYDFKQQNLIRRTRYSGPAVGLTRRF